MYKIYCDEHLLYNGVSEKYKIFNPKVTLELNKVGSFTFTIYPNHPNFDKLYKLKSIIKIYKDNYLLFKGRILNDDQGFYNEKQVTCESELAFLLDSIQRPYDFQSGDKHISVSELFTFFINNHNSQVDEEHQFKVGNITVKDENDYIVRSDSTYMNTWDSINKKLIESLDGYLIVRHEEDGNYIDYLSELNYLSNQTIEFGKNLIDFSKVIKGESIATAIIPLGAKLESTEETNNENKRLTIESVNNGIDYVYDQNAVDLYGWIFKTVTFDDVTEATNLLRKGQETLTESIQLAVSITLNGIDLSYTNKNVDSFKLGTQVLMKSKPHNLNTYLLVTKLALNLFNPKSDKLTLGTTYKSLTEKTTSSNNSINQTLSDMKGSVSAVENKMQNIESENASEISQMATEILTRVSENYYPKGEVDNLISSTNTTFTQNKSEFEFRFNQFLKELGELETGTNDKFTNISKYIRFVDGSIVLGEEGNDIVLKIENDKLVFYENNNPVAYLENRKLYVTDGEFINSLKIGKFAFIPRKNGNLSFKKVVN